jgi:hypothetical protein
LGKNVRAFSGGFDAWPLSTVAVCDCDTTAKTVNNALKRKIVFFNGVPRICGLICLKLLVDLRIAFRISVNEAAVDRERPREKPQIQSVLRTG